MKVVILLLCVLPLILADKRANLLSGLFDVAEIKKFFNDLVAKFGSNATEQQCETECKVVFTNAILETGCDTMCLSLQSFIQKYVHAPGGN